MSWTYRLDFAVKILVQSYSITTLTFYKVFDFIFTMRQLLTIVSYYKV